MSHYQKIPLNSLNIFSIPNIQNAITGSQYVNYYPVSDLTEGAPIEFNIFGNGHCITRHFTLSSSENCRC